MSFSTYATLTTAIGTWAERTFTSTETDEFIALVEAKANLKLGSTYRRMTTATVNTTAAGVGTLPTDFVAMVSITRAVLGSVPLKQVSWGALISRNPDEIADDAETYALNGLSFMVAPVTDDDFDLVYLAKLTGLSGSNTTNWLLTLLPNYYLFGCRSMACAYQEDYQGATTWGSQADILLDDLISQGNVAQYGNVEMTLDMVTP